MKPVVDFCVHSDNYNLVISDFSDWNLIKDQPTVIEILLPGYSTPIKKYYDQNKVTAYNSVSLDINCGDDPSKFEKVTLPDGIYDITLTGSPDKFSKNKKYLKTDNLELEISKIFIDAFENKCYDKIEKRLTEIEILVSASKHYLRYDNVKNSMMYFEKACDIAESLSDCNTCGCE